MIKKLVLVGFLGMVPVMASATVFGSDSHDTNTTTTSSAVANGGNGGSVIGSGNSANSNRNDNSNENRNSALSESESKATAVSAQEQGQGQLQGQGISAFNGNTTTVEAADVKGMASEFAKHAESAGDVRSNSNPATSPCGDSTGLSGQVGVAGGGLATVTETCRAFRIQMLEAVNPDATSTKLAKITHFVGWLPRTLLHVASFGVLN